MKRRHIIPTTIHYCWFGGNPLPPLAEKCIESWKTFFPNYEIKRWDESNFNVNIIPYTAEAYKAKKYAFVSDYARFWILYQYGGLYFDTDVEVIRSMDDIIRRGPFMGCEGKASQSEKAAQDRATKLRIAYEKDKNPILKPIIDDSLGLGIAPGLGLGVTPGHGLYREILEIYSKLAFAIDSKENPLLTVVDITTNIFAKDGLKNTSDIQLIDGIYIYPANYFNPLNIITRRIEITKDTRSVHHYMASWVNYTPKEKIKNFFRPFIPKKILFMWNNRKR